MLLVLSLSQYRVLSLKLSVCVYISITLPLTSVAMQAVEQDGIVFLDEIDKICSHSENRHGADASAEGVQASHGSLSDADLMWI